MADSPEDFWGQCQSCWHEPESHGDHGCEAQGCLCLYFS